MESAHGSPRDLVVGRQVVVVVVTRVHGRGEMGHWHSREEALLQPHAAVPRLLHTNATKVSPASESLPVRRGRIQCGMERAVKSEWSRVRGGGLRKWRESGAGVVV